MSRPWQARHFSADADNFFLPGLTIFLKVAVMLLAIRFWHEHLDVLANDLGGWMTEKALARRVHGLHQADFVDGDDRVNCGVKDCAGCAPRSREEPAQRGSVEYYLWPRAVLHRVE